jgi:hypothetical protein
MKNLLIQSAVMSRFSNKQSVAIGMANGNKNAGSIIDGDLRDLIKALFKVESVHVYMLTDGNEVVVDRSNGTLMVGIPYGITKDKVVAQISKYLTENKRSLVFRVVRFLGSLLGFTKLSKYADAIVGVVEVVLDLFIFKERYNGEVHIGQRRSPVLEDSVGVSAHGPVVNSNHDYTLGKLLHSKDLSDYDKPLSSVFRSEIEKN